MADGEFSTWEFYPDGTYRSLLRFVSAEEAMLAAARAIQHGAGTTVKVIVTDGGDCTNFEWIKGKGVVFPKGTVKT